MALAHLNPTIIPRATMLKKCLRCVGNWETKRSAKRWINNFLDKSGKLVAFLVSDRASSITGSEYVIGGGNIPTI